MQELSESEVAHYLESDGPLALQSEQYEERLSQINLIKKIARSFNKNIIGIFEAGTGVGKSFAYLIPSMLWALQNNERVVISTGTINLQQQLFEKDIPTVEKIIGKKINSVLMKGRQNFVCLRRLFDMAEDNALFKDSEFDAILNWAKESDDGSKSDLHFAPSDSLWQKIRSESDACMGAKCQYHSKCFVMQMRKRALNANIVLVNHHLLFADIESRLNGIGYSDCAILPAYTRLIFDEAHGIEKDATSFFSMSFQRFVLLRSLNLLYRKRKNKNVGYILELAKLSGKENNLSSLYKMIERIKNIFTDLENVALDILDSSSTFRLMPKTERASGPLVSLSASLEKELNLFLKELKYLFRNLNDDDSASSAYWEARLALKRLEAIADTALSFSEWKDNADYVFWIQKKNLLQDGKDESFVVFNKTPLDISALMNTGVFEPLQTVVCTSATLKINNSFAWWACRCGAEFAGEERLLFEDFPSSFPYKKNVLLAVPKDAPFPESVFEFQSFISKAIINLVNIAEGRTLILFTSYEMLNATYSDIKKNLSSYKILRQGSEDSSALLKEFKSLENSVLLATDSFWQGVDVPGNSLVQVVIVKLPFPVPSEPVFAARCDSISERGGSSFMELSVPEAVIKFRQGFGRLMRRSSDFGVVVVLDRRIYEKRYGKYFLNSIPETKQVYENLSELENTISSFLWD